MCYATIKSNVFTMQELTRALHKIIDDNSLQLDEVVDIYELYKEYI